VHQPRRAPATRRVESEPPKRFTLGRRLTAHAHDGGVQRMPLLGPVWTARIL